MRAPAAWNPRDPPPAILAALLPTLHAPDLSQDPGAVTTHERAPTPRPDASRALRATLAPPADADPVPVARISTPRTTRSTRPATTAASPAAPPTLATIPQKAASFALASLMLTIPPAPSADSLAKLAAALGLALLLLALLPPRRRPHGHDDARRAQDDEHAHEHHTASVPHEDHARHPWVGGEKPTPHPTHIAGLARPRPLEDHPSTKPEGGRKGDAFPPFLLKRQEARETQSHMPRPAPSRLALRAMIHTTTQPGLRLVPGGCARGG